MRIYVISIVLSINSEKSAWMPLKSFDDSGKDNYNESPEIDN